jgi:FkbM family methyltransferase
MPSNGLATSSAAGGPALHNARVEEWVAVRGDETLRLDYDLGPDSIVLDLGAYQGAFAHDIGTRYGSRLYLSEPVPQFIDQLRVRFAGDPKVTILPFAMGGQDGELSLSLDADATSMFKAGAAAVVAPVRAIDKVLDELGVDRVDLLKINVEGAEYDILEALVRSGWISRVRDIQVQFHDFVPDAPARLAALRRRLSATHFPTYLYTFVWENWRRREGQPHERWIEHAVLGTASTRDRLLGDMLRLRSRVEELARPGSWEQRARVLKRFFFGP